MVLFRARQLSSLILILFVVFVDPAKIPKQAPILSCHVPLEQLSFTNTSYHSTPIGLKPCTEITLSSINPLFLNNQIRTPFEETEKRNMDQLIAQLSNNPLFRFSLRNNNKHLRNIFDKEKTFADLIAFLKKNGINSFDISWGIIQSAPNYLPVLKKLKNLLHAEKFLLTTTIGVEVDNITASHVANISSVVDRIHLVPSSNTHYNLGKDQITGELEKAFDSLELNEGKFIEIYTSLNLNPKKIVVGLSLQTMKWKSIGSQMITSSTGINQRLAVLEIVPYHQSCIRFNRTWKLLDDQPSPFYHLAVAPTKDQWMIHVDPSTLGKRINLILQYGFAGVTLYDYYQDDFAGVCRGANKFPLIQEAGIISAKFVEIDDPIKTGLCIPFLGLTSSCQGIFNNGTKRPPLSTNADWPTSLNPKPDDERSVTEIITRTTTASTPMEANTTLESRIADSAVDDTVSSIRRKMILFVDPNKLENVELAVSNTETNQDVTSITEDSSASEDDVTENPTSKKSIDLMDLIIGQTTAISIVDPARISTEPPNSVSVDDSKLVLPDISSSLAESAKVESLSISEPTHTEAKNPEILLATVIIPPSLSTSTKVAVTEDPIETEETSVVNETHTDETTLPDHSSITEKPQGSSVTDEELIPSTITEPSTEDSSSSTSSQDHSSTSSNSITEISSSSSPFSSTDSSSTSESEGNTDKDIELSTTEDITKDISSPPSSLDLSSTSSSATTAIGTSISISSSSDSSSTTESEGNTDKDIELSTTEDITEDSSSSTDLSSTLSADITNIDSSTSLSSSSDSSSITESEGIITEKVTESTTDFITAKDENLWPDVTNEKGEFSTLTSTEMSIETMASSSSSENPLSKTSVEEETTISPEESTSEGPQTKEFSTTDDGFSSEPATSSSEVPQTHEFHTTDDDIAPATSSSEDPQTDTFSTIDDGVSSEPATSSTEDPFTFSTSSTTFEVGTTEIITSPSETTTNDLILTEETSTTFSSTLTESSSYDPGSIIDDYATTSELIIEDLATSPSMVTCDPNDGRSYYSIHQIFTNEKNSSIDFSENWLLSKNPMRLGSYDKETIPFEFPFFGQMVKNVTITPNGMLLLDHNDEQSVWNYDPKKFIAPLFSNYTYSEEFGSSVKYLVLFDDSVLVVHWKGLILGHRMDNRVSFTVVVYNYGEIFIFYKQIPDDVTVINPYPVRAELSSVLPYNNNVISMTTTNEEIVSGSSFHFTPFHNKRGKDQNQGCSPQDFGRLYYSSERSFNLEQVWTDFEQLSHSFDSRQFGAFYSWDLQTTITLSFPFHYFGQVVENVTISPYGALFLDAKNASEIHTFNQGPWGPARGVKYITSFFSTTYLASEEHGSNVRYMDNGTSLTVQWNNLMGFNDSTEDSSFFLVSFQIVLSRCGDIIFAYKEVPDDNPFSTKYDRPFYNRINILDGYMTRELDEEIVKGSVFSVRPTWTDDDCSVLPIIPEPTWNHDNPYYSSIQSFDVVQNFWINVEQEETQKIVDNKTVPLSFSFDFFDQKIDQITITENGILYVNPGMEKFSRFIAPLRSYFSTKLSEESCVKYMDNGSTFVVQWNNLVLEEQPEAGTFSFQVILSNSGDIIFVYKQVPDILQLLNENPIQISVGISNVNHIDLDNRKLIIFDSRVFPESGEVPVSGSVFITKADFSLITCASFSSCDTCLFESFYANLSCTWYPESGRCDSYFQFNSTEIREPFRISDCVGVPPTQPIIEPVETSTELPCSNKTIINNNLIIHVNINGDQLTLPQFDVGKWIAWLQHQSSTSCNSSKVRKSPLLSALLCPDKKLIHRIQQLLPAIIANLTELEDSIESTSWNPLITDDVSSTPNYSSDSTTEMNSNSSSSSYWTDTSHNISSVSPFLLNTTEDPATNFTSVSSTDLVWANSTTSDYSSLLSLNATSTETPNSIKNDTPNSPSINLTTIYDQSLLSFSDSFLNSTTLDLSPFLLISNSTENSNSNFNLTSTTPSTILNTTSPDVFNSTTNTALAELFDNITSINTTSNPVVNESVDNLFNLTTTLVAPPPIPPTATTPVSWKGNVNDFMKSLKRKAGPVNVKRIPLIRAKWSTPTPINSRWIRTTRRRPIIRS